LDVRRGFRLNRHDSGRWKCQPDGRRIENLSAKRDWRECLHFYIRFGGDHVDKDGWFKIKKIWIEAGEISGSAAAMDMSACQVKVPTMAVAAKNMIQHLRKFNFDRISLRCKDTQREAV
jgi:hypothetical protein